MRDCPHHRARLTLTLGREVEKHCADCGIELDVRPEERLLAEYVGDVIVETWTADDTTLQKVGT